MTLAKWTYPNHALSSAILIYLCQSHRYSINLFLNKYTWGIGPPEDGDGRPVERVEHDDVLGDDVVVVEEVLQAVGGAAAEEEGQLEGELGARLQEALDRLEVDRRGAVPRVEQTGKKKKPTCIS